MQWNKMKKRGLRTLICLALGLIGVVGMKALAAAKKPPATTERRAESIRAKSQVARPETVQTILNGFGEVRAVTLTEISAEVSGRVKHIHPNLREGGLLAAGEILFELDPSDYQLRVDELEATLAMASNAVARLEREQASNIDRQKLLQRTLELSDGQHARMRRLLDQENVGSQTAVEAAERERNAIAEQICTLQTEIEIHPLRMEDNACQIRSIAAQLARARLDLARCTVKAPYSARVVQCAIEANQWVDTGTSLLSLADDSSLELQVTLNSAEASRHLLFADASSKQGWFRQPAPVTCRLFASDGSDAPMGTGRLHRMVKYDRTSRMVTVAIRIEPPTCPLAWPIVDGMFCRVEIPGRKLEGVYPLPRHAVTPRSEVYCAVDGKLKRQAVKVVYTDSLHCYISEGLEEGCTVLTSRLTHPLENSPVTLEE
jgi:membrane fusion protein, multidrug efflux system